MSDIIRLHNHILKPRWEWRPKLNPNHPLSIRLVGLWLFNETGGLKAYDLSGKNNHGTLINGPVWKPGKFGQALYFDGVDDYVSLLSPTSLDDIENQGGGGMTISAWIFPNNVSANQYMVTKDSANSGFWTFWLSSSGSQVTVRWQKDFSTTDMDVYTQYGDVIAGKWQHVVLTWDGSSNANNAHIYVNSIDKTFTRTNGVGTKNSDASLNAYIGTGFYINSLFNGRIDEVRIYKRALLAKEIRWLYQEPFAGIDVPIFKDYWPEVAAGGLSIPVAMQNMRGGFKPIGMRGGFVN